MKENCIGLPRGFRSGFLFQFIKYGISGALATLVHIAVFHLLAWKIFPALQENDFMVKVLGLSVAQVDIATRSFNSMLANAGAFICSNLVAYLINVAWVFVPGRHTRSVEIGLFYMVSALSVAIGTGTMGFLIRYYGMQTTHAFAVNIVSCVLINFAMRKFFIFRA